MEDGSEGCSLTSKHVSKVRFHSRTVMVGWIYLPCNLSWKPKWLRLLNSFFKQSSKFLRHIDMCATWKSKRCLWEHPVSIDNVCFLKSHAMFHASLSILKIFYLAHYLSPLTSSLSSPRTSSLTSPLTSSLSNPLTSSASNPLTSSLSSLCYCY